MAGRSSMARRMLRTMGGVISRIGSRPRVGKTSASRLPRTSAVRRGVQARRLLGVPCPGDCLAKESWCRAIEAMRLMRFSVLGSRPDRSRAFAVSRASRASVRLIYSAEQVAIAPETAVGGLDLEAKTATVGEPMRVSRSLAALTCLSASIPAPIPGFLWRSPGIIPVSTWARVACCGKRWERGTA